MALAPSVMEIANVIQTAYKVYMSIQRETSEFRSTAREIWSLHETLKEIEAQFKKRSSPLRRDQRRASVLRTHISDTHVQLQALQSALDRYNSLWL